MNATTTAYAPVRIARRIAGRHLRRARRRHPRPPGRSRGQEDHQPEHRRPLHFDFKTPEIVVEAIVKALRDNQTSYSASEGHARGAGRHPPRRRGAGRGSAQSRSIFVGHGASEPIELLLNAHPRARRGRAPAQPRLSRSTPPSSPRSARRAVHYNLDESQRLAAGPATTSSGWWTRAPAPWC